jgi:hypothetical protein
VDYDLFQQFADVVGEVFLAECRTSLAAMDTAVRKARRAAEQERVTIAVRTGAGPGVLPAAGAGKPAGARLRCLSDKAVLQTGKLVLVRIQGAKPDGEAALGAVDHGSVKDRRGVRSCSVDGWRENDVRSAASRQILLGHRLTVSWESHGSVGHERVKGAVRQET